MADATKGRRATAAGSPKMAGVPDSFEQQVASLQQHLSELKLQLEETRKNVDDLQLIVNIQGKVVVKPIDFKFQDKYDRNTIMDVYVENDGQTARRGSDSQLRGGIVVSRDPMQPGELYQVKLIKQHKGSEPLPVGVIMGSPEERYHIRYNPQRLESAVVVYKNTIYSHSRQTNSSLGNKLANLHEGDTVGVVLDARNIPHLYVNGTDQGELTSFPLDDDCYAMFCLHCEKRQITVNTSMPRTRVL